MDHSIRYPFDPPDHRTRQLREQRSHRLKIAPQMITKTPSLHRTPGPARSRNVGQIQL